MGSPERSDRRDLATLEAEAVPAEDWAEEALAAHRAAPLSPACAGEIQPFPKLNALGLGAFLSDYVDFAPPGEPRVVCGLNCSFRRDTLERTRTLLNQGVWESELCNQWVGEGLCVAPSNARVELSRTVGRRRLPSQRYHYGRDYAARRDLWGAKRMVYAFGAPLLPPLLMCLSLLKARSRGLLATLAVGAPWALTLNVAWAAGEAVGYLAGPSARPRIR